MARLRRRSLVGMITLGWLLVVLPGAVAADSVTGEIIRQLNRQLLYMAIPIAVLVEVILVYAVVRFRNRERPSPTTENRQLEITWTVATALVLVFVGTASFTALAHPMVATVPESVLDDASDATAGHSHGPNGVAPGSAPENATEVVGVARQWNWQFEYPGANVTADELVLPSDRDVYVYVTSEDVLHSLHVPALGLKQDAFPGQYNLIRTRVLENGTYTLYCAEFCGVDHANMQATVRIVDPGDFDRWLASGGTANVTEIRSSLADRTNASGAGGAVGENR